MKASQVERLCVLYELGNPVDIPQEVTGGFVHRIWRLSTTHGSYAIKQLNSIIAQYPNILDTYRMSERIAAAMLTEGVPAVAALKSSDNDILKVIENDVFQVYEWVDGIRLSSHAVGSERARRVGSILAKMHLSQHSFPGLVSPDLESVSDDVWDMLTFQASDRGTGWVQRVRNALPRISEWSQWASGAGEILEQTLVVSHRDFDQKNVLWRDAHNPAIIDWESAGLTNPTMELVGAALSWSGLVVGMPNEECFNALLEGYIASGGVIRDVGITAIHGVIGNWLGWLLFNMHRSLGEPVLSEQERQPGESETIQTLTLLYTLANNAETWASWVERYR